MQALFYLGVGAGAALVLLLLLTIIDRRFSIWPVPMGAGWKSLAFWGLFRALNAAALIYLLLQGLTLGGEGDHASLLVRSVGAFTGALCALAFVAVGFQLGKDALYGRGDGLESAGLYRYSRNPQYAAAILGYVAGGVFAWSLAGWVLASMAIAVYMLMVRAEEPWLHARYGVAYERYVMRVPRFFSLRSLLALGMDGYRGSEGASLLIQNVLKAQGARALRSAKARRLRSPVPVRQGR